MAKKSVSLSVGRGEKLPVSQGAGLTEKGRAKYNAATGSNLKAPAPKPKMVMNEPEHNAVGENTISSEQLQTYLLSKKWFEDGKIRNVATVWHRHEDDDAEIILPLPEARDYQQRFIEAVSTIALRDERGVLEIINEIKRPFFNLISVRVIHSDTNDGTIPDRCR